MPPALTRTETWSLLVLFGACAGVVVNSLQGDGNPLSASIAFGGAAFAVTFCLIRWLGDAFIKVGLKGKDMSKVRKVEMSVTCSRHTPKANWCQTDPKLWVLCAPQSIS
jgi:UDP-N-acetylglucosamine--dolichyl-phosphate N-acetylglucosaminephosphotransferase